MSIEIIKRKKGIAYRAIFGSRDNRQRKTFNRKLDAQRWLVERADRSQEIRKPNPNSNETPDSRGKEDSNSLKLQDVYELYKRSHAEIRLQASTLKRDGQIIAKSLLPYFGDKPVNEFSQKDVQEYIRWEAKTGHGKQATINKHHQILHKVWFIPVEGG